MSKMDKEQELHERSIEMKKRHKEFFDEYMRPHEKENIRFIHEIIRFYNIRTIEEFKQYEYLMPDCTSKYIFIDDFERGFYSTEKRFKVIKYKGLE